MSQKKPFKLVDQDIDTTDHRDHKVTRRPISKMSTVAIALGITLGATATVQGCRALRTDATDCNSDTTQYADFTDSFDDTTSGDTQCD